MKVHDLVGLATSEAPPLRRTVDQIVESGQRVQRRRRIGWGVAGLAAVAVVAAVTVPYLGAPATKSGTANQAAAGGQAASTTTTSGTTVITPGEKPAAPPAKSFTVPAPPFTFTFSAYDVGRFHVHNPIVASTAYQIAGLYADGLTTNDAAVDPSSVTTTDPKKVGVAPAGGQPTLYAYLTLYQPGSFDQHSLVGAQQVTIAGHQGLELSAGDSGMYRRTLAWEYAPGAWAVINSSCSSQTDPSAADLRGVAAGLRPTVPAVAKLPFKMSYVPAGYKAAELGSHAMSGLNGIASAGDGDFGGAIFARPAPSTTGLTAPFGGPDGGDLPGSFEIFIVPNDNSNQALKNGEAPPNTPRCSKILCNRWSADGKVNIQVASNGRVSEAEMSRIVSGITLDDVNAPSTWTDATIALRVGH